MGGFHGERAHETLRTEDVVDFASFVAGTQRGRIAAAQFICPPSTVRWYKIEMPGFRLTRRRACCAAFGVLARSPAWRNRRKACMLGSDNTVRRVYDVTVEGVPFEAHIQLERIQSVYLECLERGKPLSSPVLFSDVD